MRFPLIALLLAGPLLLSAQEAPDACERLRTARVLLPLVEREETAGRIAATLVADTLHDLRGPRPDGSYRWARLSEQAAQPVEKGVDVDRDRLEWKAEGTDWFALNLKCPSKKNLFWGNAPVMVRSVAVDDGTGPPKVLLRDRRLARGEEIKVPFGSILSRVTVAVVFEKLPEGERDPYVEVAGLQAGLLDDGANPQAELVKRVADLAGEKPGGDWYASRLDRALEGCAKPVRRELETILYLLNGTSREQEEGRRRLAELLERM